jgi:hypothetical protein
LRKIAFALLSAVVFIWLAAGWPQRISGLESLHPELHAPLLVLLPDRSAATSTDESDAATTATPLPSRQSGWWWQLCCCLCVNCTALHDMGDDDTGTSDTQRDISPVSQSKPVSSNANMEPVLSQNNPAATPAAEAVAASDVVIVVSPPAGSSGIGPARGPVHSSRAPALQALVLPMSPLAHAGLDTTTSENTALAIVEVTPTGGDTPTNPLFSPKNVSQAYTTDAVYAVRATKEEEQQQQQHQHFNHPPHHHHRGRRGTNPPPPSPGPSPSAAVLGVRRSRSRNSDDHEVSDTTSSSEGPARPHKSKGSGGRLLAPFPAASPLGRGNSATGQSSRRLQVLKRKPGRYMGRLWDWHCLLVCASLLQHHGSSSRSKTRPSSRATPAQVCARDCMGWCV